MAQTRAALVTLYSDQTGLTLECQPLTAAGADTGAVVAGTTTERGGGQYRWVGSVPDDAEAGDFRSAADHAFLTQEAFVEVPPVAGSGGFTGDDRNLLGDIAGKLTVATITVVPDVLDGAEGQEFTVHQDFDYKPGSGQAKYINLIGIPDLTGGGVQLEEEGDDTHTPIGTGEIITASDTDPQLVRFSFTRTQTADLSRGDYSVRIRATLANDDEVYSGGLTMHVRQ